ncbi:MAG: glycoside hydrolase family 2 [Oscillospiraceae bacterium]|nr:glycoside hydrolase family 2 [Oscillospiraceae bacterium]
MSSIPRPEYPRPDFERKDWFNLNGNWEFSFDKPTYDRTITVPFCYQSKASGIGDTTDHDVVWYKRVFPVDGGKIKKGRLLLHFGAVDYFSKLWINDVLIGEHKGGHCSFFFDITEAVKAGENTIVLRVEDYQETDKPRGKQTWTGDKFGCWYTPTTGIWQSVWLEYAGDIYAARVKITPDTKTLTALCEVFLSSHDKTVVELTARLNPSEAPYDSVEKAAVQKPEVLCKTEAICINGYGKSVFSFKDMDLRRDRLQWSPEHPNLIDVDVVVKGKNEDSVKTYFGMRAVEIEKDKLLLNAHFCYQRLILDQGYWPDTLLTPPSDKAIIEDINLTKQMGFNGARKHQKIEDPRYYYWADKLGLMVWGELPSAYEFNDNAVVNSSREMIEFINRDYNHPSIVAWVPVNESWGVCEIRVNKQQQDYSRALIYLIKSLDATRFISGNDGWEQPSETDICAIHDYSMMPQNLYKYDDMQKIFDTAADARFIYAEGNGYKGQPVLMTEYGGIAFESEDSGWGYLEKVSDEKSFIGRLGPVTEFLLRSGKFTGFCYTQLTDVMQEINGLLTEDRKPKIPIDKLNEIFGMRIY